jgi:hypothetical protein
MLLCTSNKKTGPQISVQFRVIQPSAQPAQDEYDEPSRAIDALLQYAQWSLSPSVLMLTPLLAFRLNLSV